MIRRLARAVWLFVRAQVIAGLALGLMLRLAMRVVALSSGRAPVLTVEGTTFILVVAIVLSAVPNLAFFVLRRRVGGTPLHRGITFGLCMVAVGSLAVLPEALTVGHPWLNVPMFWAILVGDGVVFSLVVDRLERRSERRRAGGLSPVESPVPATQGR